MLILPERETYRPFTEAELDRLGVPDKSLTDFLTCVLVSMLKPTKGFYPMAVRDGHSDGHLD
jgi:hypothetical protein